MQIIYNPDETVNENKVIIVISKHFLLNDRGCMLTLDSLLL